VLFGSVAVDVHVPGLEPQTTCPFGHGWHWPPAHEDPIAQRLPHAPQLFASVVVSAQTPAPGDAPLQSVVPFGHVHWPETHEAPWSHGFPQAPQLDGSFVVSTQLPEQLVSPALHTHAPLPETFWHDDAAGHVLPHAPQLKLSFVVLTQAPLHMVGADAGHPQTVLVQMPLVKHFVPHDPQFCGSFCKLAHPDGHVVVPTGHVQTPLTHAAPGLHALPHVLQLAGSVCLLVHTELQTSGLPAGQLQLLALHVAPFGQT
jgi:hypothetical protein